jgi:hypothetical protein
MRFSKVGVGAQHTGGDLPEASKAISKSEALAMAANCRYRNQGTQSVTGRLDQGHWLIDYNYRTTVSEVASRADSVTPKSRPRVWES